MSSKSNPLIEPHRLASVLVKLLFACIYCFGLSRLVLDVLALPLQHFEQGFMIVLFIAMAAVLTWQLYNLAAFGGIWMILLILSFIFQKELKSTVQTTALQVREWFDWAIAYLSGQPSARIDYMNILAVVICLITAIVSYLLVARFNRYYLAGAVLLYFGIDHEMFIGGGLIWFLLAAVPVIIAVARKQKRTYRKMNWHRYPAQGRFMLEALPIVLIVLSLAVGISSIVPGALYQSKPVIQTVNILKSDVLEALEPYVDLTDEIHTFNIANSGFSSLSDRLGGPIVLSNRPVMEITGYTEPMLLRGAIGETYDGHRWLPGNDSELYSFNKKSEAAKQQSVFNYGNPSIDIILGKMSYSIKPVETGISTIFLAGRPDKFMINGDSTDVYYNSEGLLTKQPALLKGQKLTVYSSVFLFGSEFDYFVDSKYYDMSEESDLARRKDLLVFEHDLQLPELPEYKADGFITQVVDAIVYETDSPWQKAQKIENYLETFCDYSLSVETPPANEEFVSYFINSKEGYCVYFATAMTMLCRAAGIPARYVEGYAVQGGIRETQVRLVTEKQAHAWTEVFLSGIGWVPIDATPGGATIDPVVTPTPDAGTVTPQPTATPAAPKPSNTPTPAPAKPALTINDILNLVQLISVLFLIILLLLPITYLIVSYILYRKRRQTDWLHKRFHNNSRLAVYFWQDILTMLKQLGVRPLASETPRQLIERTLRDTTWLSGRREAVEILLDGVEKSLYSQHQPSDDEMQNIERLHEILEKTLWQNTSRILFVLRRICYHKQKQDMDE